MKLTANSNHIYFVTLTVVYWIDVFTRPIYKDIIVNNLSYCQKHKGLEIFSYVIMTNHLHLILRSQQKPLSDTLRDFKTYTSKELFKAIKNNPQESRKEWILKLMQIAGKKNSLNKNHQFWKNYNQPILLDTIKKFNIKQNYIHQNPVKAGIVANDYDYFYSSANEQSPIKIDEY